MMAFERLNVIEGYVSDNRLLNHFIIIRNLLTTRLSSRPVDDKTTF